MGDRRVVGVLLAGGLSRRMGGGDKCLLPLAGRPMLAHAIERLASQVGATVLNANGDPTRFGPFGLSVVQDPVEGFAGPLAGILAGMRWSKANAPGAVWVASAATDTPFFPRDLVARLIEAAGEDPGTIALAASGGHRHPVFGLWPIALADDLEHALTRDEIRKVLVWVSRHPNATADFPIPVRSGRPRDPFFNANTAEDLAEAGTWLREDAA